MHITHGYVLNVTVVLLTCVHVCNYKANNCYVLNVTVVLLTCVHVCNYKANNYYATNAIKLTGSMHVYSYS